MRPSAQCGNAENISAELAHLQFFEDIKAHCFSPGGISIAGGGHFCELFSILRRMHKTCNESVYKQLHESNVRK